MCSHLLLTTLPIFLFAKPVQSEDINVRVIYIVTPFSIMYIINTFVVIPKSREKLMS
jgi:hypothetical protein